MKQSPLHDEHVALGAKLVPFGGWDMPLSYPLGTVGEHMACRNEAVAFDVSHLGTVRVTGADAFEVLNRTFTNDLHKIEQVRAEFSHLPSEALQVRAAADQWNILECFAHLNAFFDDYLAPMELAIHKAKAHRWPNVRVRGLMGMATNTEDRTLVSSEFAGLAGLFREIRETGPYPTDQFCELSMGMTSDADIAVAQGSTMVRIGTAIFGDRS